MKKFIPANIWAWLREYHSNYLTSRSPDRAVFLGEVIPAFAQTSALSRDADVLWIGCRRYTKSYYTLLERQGARCWTMDIDPSATIWGRKGRHVVGNILDLASLYPNQRFDAIFCNGIFGWGVDTESTQKETSAAMASVTKPEGWMLLGWNTNRIPDPVHTITPWFRTTNLPGFGTRRAIEGSTHVYDIFRRREDVRAS